MAAAFLAAGFLAAAFLAAGFLAAAFLAAGFLAAAFLAAGFLATAFLAAGFLATAFLAAGLAFFFTAAISTSFGNQSSRNTTLTTTPFPSTHQTQCDRSLLIPR